MSNYSYGFDSGPERRSGSSRLRFTLIFILISAATAALVWWFWPRSGKEKTVPGKKESQTVSVNAAKGSDGVPSGRVGPAGVGKKTLPAGKVGGESVAAPPPAGKTADEAAGGKAALPDPSDPPLPDKGIVTPADQKGTDLPEIAVAEKTDPLREEALKKAAALLAEKQFADAEKFAEQALAGAAENTPFFRNAWRVLSAARVEGIYGGKSRWLVPCRINSGDTLSAIASKHNTTVELLRKSNKISGSRIYVGRTLRVPPAGAWRIVVSKKSRLLRLYFKEKGREESLFGLWEIGVGRMGKTPSADFAVAARVRHH